MKRLSITLTDSQAEALERIAAETGATRQSMIGLAISAWISDHEARAMIERTRKEKAARAIDRRDAMADEEDAMQEAMMHAPQWAGWCRTHTDEEGTRDHERKLFDTDTQASRHAAAVAMRYRNMGYEDADPCWEPCDSDGIPIFL